MHEPHTAYESMSEPSDKEILWRDYALNADLYKFYLDILLKLNIFCYGITGGIVSYCLSNHQMTVVRWALVLPLLMSVFFGVLCLYSSFLARELDSDTFELSKKLSLGTSHAFSPLVYFLRLSAALQASCVIGIGFLVWMWSA